jgi:hypothetical protein
MGSYAECWLGKFYVGSTKEGVHPDLIGLFRSTDKHIRERQKAVYAVSDAPSMARLH